MPRVSVIIPVYNNEKDLPICLGSIMGQSISNKDYEVIVIDNNSKDNTVQVIKDHPVIFGREKRQSSYAARNKGITLAKSEYLIFTDADCKPTKEWLKAYLDCLSKTGSKLIAGGIELTMDDPDNAWMMYDKLNHLNQKLLVETKKFAATANLMVHKEVFEEVGKFDPTLISGGDSEFGQRATIKFDMVYCPEAKIYHPARGSFRGLIKKKYRLGFGFAQRYRKDTGGPLTFGDMLRGVIPAIGYLNQNFRILKVVTDHDIPKSSKMRLKLFFIDFIGKTAQFFGELQGRYNKE
jgi:glycosyltransferase involved in cell wall biosynthesis